MIRRRARTATDDAERLISAAEWRAPRPLGRRLAQLLLLVGLLVFGLGPILWLAKSAITPTNDTISHPMSLFPHGVAWGNLSKAWIEVHVGRYFWNTVVLAFGSWAVQIVVATTGGFVLSVLRPWYARHRHARSCSRRSSSRRSSCSSRSTSRSSHPPLIHHSFIDSYWAIWLPAGASAFNVILVDPLLRQPAARDLRGGARRRRGPVPALLLRSCCRCRSRSSAVVSVFAVLASWKDFLWPLLVLTNPDKQPLSVRLPIIQSQTELGVFLAAMFIACLVPIVGFLIFQRPFLRGTGLGGAVKG